MILALNVIMILGLNVIMILAASTIGAHFRAKYISHGRTKGYVIVLSNFRGISIRRENDRTPKVEIHT